MLVPKKNGFNDNWYGIRRRVVCRHPSLDTVCYRADAGAENFSEVSGVRFRGHAQSPNDLVNL